LFGFAAGESPGWKNLLSTIHPDDREHVQNSVDEALRTGKEFVEEFRVVCTDGSARWIASRGRIQFGSNLTLQRLMGACVDVTERKRAEAEAREHREELAHLSRVAIMGEMAVNAFEAMRETPAAERQVIIRSERESGGRVRVSVRDFGTGLPAEDPERIFERFFSTKREGMGMGMAIARSIITSHGGELAAANADGGGACLYFLLPVMGKGQ
jgi:PAS domain S-box-containing protein